jgi:hypothetical protein
MARLPAGLTRAASPPTINQLTGHPAAIRPEARNLAGMDHRHGRTPHWVPGLTVSTDYYTVLVRNEISTYDPEPCWRLLRRRAYIVSQAVACANWSVPRAATAPGPINAINANIGDENTSGIDIDVDYGIDAAKMGLPVPGHMTSTARSTTC